MGKGTGLIFVFLFGQQVHRSVRTDANLSSSMMWQDIGKFRKKGSQNVGTIFLLSGVPQADVESFVL